MPQVVHQVGTACWLRASNLTEAARQRAAPWAVGSRGHRGHCATATVSGRSMTRRRRESPDVRGDVRRTGRAFFTLQYRAPRSELQAWAFPAASAGLKRSEMDWAVSLQSRHSFGENKKLQLVYQAWFNALRAQSSFYICLVTQLST